jgi:hypothetical protein
MPDLETAKGGGIGQGRFVVLPYMSAHLTLKNRVEKGAHFLFFAGGLEFYPAVGEVAHRTRNVKPLRDIPDRPAKAHALDITFVKDLNGCGHASED